MAIATAPTARRSGSGAKSSARLADDGSVLVAIDDLKEKGATIWMWPPPAAVRESLSSTSRLETRNSDWVETGRRSGPPRKDPAGHAG